MPIQYCSGAMRYCQHVFGTGRPDGATVGPYSSCIYSHVVSEVLSDLKKETPSGRLMFCTSALCMGFDSPSVDRVIHARRPRSLNDYVPRSGASRPRRTTGSSHPLLWAT